MQLVPVNDTDKGIVHHINPEAIEAITDYGTYRIVIFGHSRLVHTKQTVGELSKAIENAELRAQWQPGDSPYYVPPVLAEAVADENCEYALTPLGRSTADEL